MLVQVYDEFSERPVVDTQVVAQFGVILETRERYSGFWRSSRPSMGGFFFERGKESVVTRAREGGVAGWKTWPQVLIAPLVFEA